MNSRGSACRIARRKAIVAVQVAVVLVVLLGMAALCVDVGAMYNARSDLQRTADSAALAAAARLADWDNGPPLDAARATAIQFAEYNTVLGQSVTLDPGADIVFGTAILDAATRTYAFNPGTPLPNAVRIQVRKTSDSPNGALSLYFANVFGKSSTNIMAEATAMMTPRDIAIVSDLSSSHNDDSELRNYKTTDVNFYDVWDQLPGGADDIGTIWDVDEIPPEWFDGSGHAAQAAGPAWGYMQNLGFGTQTIDSAYDPATDPGLIDLAYNQTWTDTQLENALTDQGYNATEVAAIMSSTYDANGAYKYRVAVAMGFASWNSGVPGGRWDTLGASPGNGNAWISASELQWNESIFDSSVAASSNIFLDYIDNYMTETWTMLYQTNHGFQYKYGIKTFMNYLIERRPSHQQTPEFADVQLQPMQAIKDAVAYLSGYLDSLDSSDMLSLEVYATTARHEVDLTHDYQAIANRMTALQPNYYDGLTNIGGGLAKGIEELTGPRARPTSQKMIILLTDGLANINGSGQWDLDGAKDYALAEAQAAADQGIRVFAVSVGSAADQSLMQEIADIGQGEHLHAAGSIDDYSAALKNIFFELGNRRVVELIQ